VGGICRAGQRIFGLICPTINPILNTVMNITPEQIDQVLKNNLKHKTPVKVAYRKNGLGWLVSWIFASDGWAHSYGTCVKGTSIIPIRRTRWYNAKTKKVLDRYGFREIFETNTFLDLSINNL
jgi:hypothetical protein